MVHSDSYLFLSRHDIYYFRAVIPYGIRDDLYRKEYRRSMQTRNLQVARSMARALRVCFEAHLPRMATYMISWEELKKIFDRELARLIEVEQNKLKKQGPYPQKADDIWNHYTIPNYEQAIQTISDLRIEQSSDSQGNLPEFVVNLAEKLLQSANLKLDRSSDQYLLFCEQTVRMYLEFTRQRITLNNAANSFLSDQFQVSSSPVIASAPNKVIGKPLSEVVELFCSEMVSGGNWTEKTESEYRTAYRLLISVTNDMPISAVDFSTAQLFKETLKKLPSNMNKKALYRGKALNEVVAMKIPSNELLSISKVNSYIGRVSQLFIWTGKNGYYKELNPFAGAGIKNKGADHEKRLAFDDADINALFSTPVFIAGEFKHPHYYWLPLLGLFTGARLNELCQLYLDDIYQEDGIWVIDINDKRPDQRLKTASSARVIPMSSRLIELGLPEYVATLKKKGHSRLFPELKKERDGYGQSASKWFARYRQKYGVTHARKDFHSFRHTVIDFLKKRDAVKEKIIALVGHKDESITTGLYGKPYKASELVSTIAFLDFPVEVIQYKFT